MEPRRLESRLLGVRGQWDYIRSFVIMAIILAFGFFLVWKFVEASGPRVLHDLRHISNDVESMIATGGPGFEAELNISSNTIVSMSGNRIKVEKNTNTYWIPSGNMLSLPLEELILGPGDYRLRFEIGENQEKVMVTLID